MSAHEPSDTSDAPHGLDPTTPADPSADATLPDDADSETRLPVTDPNPADVVTDRPTIPLTREYLPPDISPSSPPHVPGYELLVMLGKGGMGEVWKARQIKLNRVVALKMVPGGYLAGEKDLIRFLAEAEVVAAVKHSHVVQVYEYGDADGRPFLAMEYLPGGSLTDRLKQTGRLSPLDAAKLVGTLAAAVQAAHDLGIVHRDLKPGNVLYDENGQPKVTDFGLAKRAGGSDLTATQAVMGTPAYMAPEQARGDTKFVGPQADVYSLGVILYECLSGRRPFDASTAQALLRKVIEEEPERPRKRVPGLPRDIELFCLKCLAKDPTERYPTAGELAADLDKFVAGEPVSVRAAGIVERAAKWALRKPTLAAAYALGLLAVQLGGLGGIALWQWREAERQREKFERFEYGRTMQVAHQEWRENNVAAARALLDSTRADFRGWEWDYVHRLCHQSEQLTLKGHTGAVSSASFSPDGSRVVTASGDRTAKIWDAKSGVEVRTLKGHTGAVTSASFSPDGSRLVTTSYDQTAKIWDATRGAEVLTLKGHTGIVLLASFSLDGSRVVTASGDRTATIWDAKTGAEVRTLKGHTGAVSSASFSPDGSRLVTTSYDQTAKIWDATRGAEVLTLKGHTSAVSSASFSRDESRVVTASWDQTAKVWDAKSGAEVRTLKGHTGAVSSASFSRDGSRVVTASADTTAKVWDARPFKPEFQPSELTPMTRAVK
jgi:predicted oxidoreductase (fatty acid repression mutant protein)